MKVLSVTVVLLLIAGSVGASGKKVDVPFLFTEDQAIAESDLQGDIGSSEALRSDRYLTAPVTRLEYMLTRLEERLNQDNTIAVIKGELRERFDRPRHPIEERVEGFARYSDEHGKIVAGYTIEQVGRPRVPMRASCDNMLKTLSYFVPQELLGFTYHNTVLGVLAQKSHFNYSATLEKLASHLVHRVTISSVTEDGNVHHTLRCQRQAKDALVVYEKHSFRLPPRPTR